MNKYKDGRLGYSLMEAAITLGIIGVVLGSIWLASASIYKTNKIRIASENIIKIAQNTRMLYAERSRFSNSTPNGTELTNMLINAKAIPADIIDASTNKPQTPWYTNMRIIVDSPTAFEIILDPTLPEDDCYHLSMMMVGPGREPALTRITQNGSNMGPIGSLNVSNLVKCTRTSFVFNLN